MSKNAVFFIAGATIGALASWYITKKKYEKIAQEEIQSVTDAFSERLNKLSRNSMQDPDIYPSPEDLEKEASKPGDRSVIDYAAVLAKQGYTDYTQFSREDTPVKEFESDEIYDAESSEPEIIAPDDYGENPEYEQLEWVYFADHILTDDDYTPITDCAKWIGADALKHFGDYEDEAIHIRNDRRKCYIEVVMDSRLYASVVAEKNKY